MAELLPTLQAKEIREHLTHYLSTTFALTEPGANNGLSEFMADPQTGVFKGPFLRLRLPFQAAEQGWEDHLEIAPQFPPYGHQAAAFARLSSKDLEPEERPLPTLVTTGTGSGKTEAFLYPILDHVRRAKLTGQQGIKALILYPMNALANDQAMRINTLVTQMAGLEGITVGLYTGQDKSALETAAGGLITDRYDLRKNPPDILLTNYKMLDQLLLRPSDQNLWKESARSLQYLVLDEFHTYDGAQGTDVAMLLRRLGLALKSYWSKEDPDLTEGDWNSPLGTVTPVATSATLGDKGDPGQMLAFARTVFGVEFPPDSVVTEARVSPDVWGQTSVDLSVGVRVTPVSTDKVRLWELVEDVKGFLAILDPDQDRSGVDPRLVRFGEDTDLENYSGKLAALVFSHFFAVTQTEGVLLGDSLDVGENEPLELIAAAQVLAGASHDDLLKLEKLCLLTGPLVEASGGARSLRDLAEQLFLPQKQRAIAQAQRLRRDGPVEDPRVEALEYYIAALSHVRAEAGREALTVELHMWVREVSRVNRKIGYSPAFHWQDDGHLTGENPDSDNRASLPAIFCRQCGRSGWQVLLAPTGGDLSPNDDAIRREAMNGSGRVRALIYAPNEGLQALEGKKVSNLHWFDTERRTILSETPAVDELEADRETLLPVLTFSGLDANDLSSQEVCPNCDRPDSIRALGSRIATLLSVTLSTMFGSQYVDVGEKKALVFTDSVQDAAHRAGFVQARSHSMTLRAALNTALGDEPQNLVTLVDSAIDQAAGDQHKRFRLVPPDCTDRWGYQEYWQEKNAGRISKSAVERVRSRLLFDASLEFGLQHTLGRTLELTGSVQAEVQVPSGVDLVALGREALEGYSQSPSLTHSVDEVEVFTDAEILRWVTGILERMRSDGAINHPWLDRYTQHDGLRIWIWGKRPRDLGMPAFPKGRPGMAFPRGGQSLGGRADSDFVNFRHAKSWYSIWAMRNLQIESNSAATLTQKLLRMLAKSKVITELTSETGAYIYGLDPKSIWVKRVESQELESSEIFLECEVCQTITPATSRVVAILATGPCTLTRCDGRQVAKSGEPNFYRELYSSENARRIVSREHTSLLEDNQRLEYENGFKSSAQNPGDPNVLVATPTLEMGIDIGDLSTVLLASLPETVASYVQRVGRAGRQTGNALDLAYVRGNSVNLPKLDDPLSVINGAVRAPATYLAAEEILRRQYLATVIDKIAREQVFEIPRNAERVFSPAPGKKSALAQIIGYAEENANDCLAGFLGQFDSLGIPHFDEAAVALRAWATPVDGTGTSALAAEAFGAGQRWSKVKDEIKFRLAQIDEVAPEIELRAKNENASEDDVKAGRSLKGERRLLVGQQVARDKQNWIQAFEELGLLPNYTLLDDSVELDISIGWRNPETREFETDELTLTRSAANAIREFVPGATFYARGFKTKIQSIDFGAEGSEVYPTAFCNACGYSERISDVGTKSVTCPRCGSAGINDTGQIFDVVELRKVSSEIMRDEAMISDSQDDRVQTTFGIVDLADIDASPQNLARQWYLKDSEFGVRYLRKLTITQLNLGKGGPGGQESEIGGRTQRVPMFAVCSYCGKLDSSTNRNSPSDHRAWCIHRKSYEEHNRRLVISRTLSTQGLVLRLPEVYTLGDETALPSLIAAIFLGLREHIGGEPDHLEVISAIDPYLADGSKNREAVLIHDRVPGGTGYLADLADPVVLRKILYGAYLVVSRCACEDEGLKACAQCLLPYSRGRGDSYVSRSSATRILTEILNESTDTEPEEDPDPVDQWVTVQDVTLSNTSESHLEVKFRTQFKELLESRGARVTTKHTDSGIQLDFRLPNGKHAWTLKPQVSYKFVRPDFVLQSDDPNLPPVSIFTDGYQFHGKGSNNIIAEDAEKRNALRKLGHVVLSITNQDLELDGSGYLPSWFDQGQASVLNNILGERAETQTYAVADQGPMGMLWSFVYSASAAGLAGLGTIAGFYWNLYGSGLVQGSAEGSLKQLANGLANSRVSPDSLSEALETLEWGSGDFFVAALQTQGNLFLNQSLISPPGSKVGHQIKVLAVHDDSDSALQQGDHRDTWQEWLTVSNLLAWMQWDFEMAALSQLQESGEIVDESLTTALSAVERNLEGQWDLREFSLEPHESALLQELATLLSERSVDLEEVRSGLVIGYESEQGVPLDIAWPEYRLATSFDMEEADRIDAVSDGWQMIGCTAPELADAIELVVQEMSGAN
ncbi:DEAD/DEAH box helicase [Jonesiaceae bacterium BS-20]|uniref:DEAD/DEAH box helicase n=1 Tax=Jonesiaceae bacterium BS-20 TaxID=3120821 RepID=A0AAU7DSH7_9MICO